MDEQFIDESCEPSIPLIVLLKLDELNEARRIYEETTDEGLKAWADVEFADCYDWLVSHDILFYYDREAKLWLRITSD
ncbi:MAG TPA: hypothetical protein VL461_14700, partial [Dictyobacter sp.]|nr:hypothetical protein [Dictyobacter sp.]